MTETKPSEEKKPWDIIESLRRRGITLTVTPAAKYDPTLEQTVTETIRFYRANERWGQFSNLFRRVIIFDGEIYGCAEAAYQAGKPRKPEVRTWLMAAPSPSLLAAAAHALNSWDIAPGWSQGRYDRMLRVVRAKFTQHADLAAILLSTGDARIAETATVDNDVNRRWGEVACGKDGWKGTNWLGEILQKVREELKGGG